MNEEVKRNIAATLHLALAAEQRGAREEALTSYRHLLTFDPLHPGALLRIAQAGLRRGDPERANAIALLRRAVESARRRELGAQALPIHSELLIAMRNEPAEARLAAVLTALADCGEVPGLLWEACECLRTLGRAQERLHRLNRLAALQPRDPVILAALGLALLGSNSAPLAIEPMRDAIALGYDDDEFTLALAAAEIQNNLLEIARLRLDRLREKNRAHFGSLGLRWHLAMQCCDWDAAQAMEAELLTRIERGEAHRVLTPWRLLASAALPELLRDYAKNFAQIEGALSSEPILRTPSRSASARLRIGYLSSDFHQHATALLLAGVFDHHDRSRFEIFAYSYGARVQDEYQQRLRSQFEHWRELNALSDHAAAMLIAGDDIDVLIELKGHTYGTRPGIAALRPAPVQAHYLGYPGTLAMQGIDYLIADKVVAPPENERHFVETIVRLPDCYQANDDRRVRPSATSRAALGLPDDAIVLCNFNQSWKWSRSFVEIWLRALATHPRALLWLLDPGVDHPAKNAVAAAAARAGVAAQIVWAANVSPHTHLARLAAADLALDQLPCNSHTTAADALWMGVPVLTCQGESFHGRVGASLLQAVNLQHFVTHSHDEYQAKLCEALVKSDQISSAKESLVKHYRTSSLFHAKAFTADWETLLATLHTHHPS